MTHTYKSVSPEFYDKDYYNRYHKGLIFTRGDKPFIYGHWVQFFRRKKESSSLFLDIGCGEGYLCKRSSEIFKTYGMDISLDALKLAQEHSPQTRFSLGSAEGKIPFKENIFDIVVSCDVLEHLPSPLLLLQNIERVLKPDGWVLLSTPNPDSWGKAIQKSQWFGYRDESHCSIIPKTEWVALIQQTRLSIYRSGSDFFWDIPYALPIPTFIQKLLLVPCNIILNRIFGFIPWNKGENLWFILKKSKN